MIFKNIMSLFNLFYLLNFIIFVQIMNTFLIETNISSKFFLFLMMFFIFMGMGFFYNLDGMMMLIIVSELSVMLMFITMFSQLYSFTNKMKRVSSMIFSVLLMLLNYSFYEIKTLKYTNFYSYSNMSLNDFYYIYNYFFEKQILVTILVMFIMTIYSIIFILFYFNFKKHQNFEQSKMNNMLLLSKQNIMHQSNYLTKVSMFQKK